MSVNSSNDNADKSVTSCGASTTFNFTVGAVAIAVAGVIGYLVYSWYLAG